MLINRADDYAIRIMACLAVSGKMTADKIGEHQGIPISFTKTISSKLKRCGLLESFQGSVDPGFALAKRPEEISLYDIIKVNHPEFMIHYCLTEDKSCPVKDRENCKAQQYFEKLQQGIIKDLSSARLSDII